MMNPAGVGQTDPTLPQSPAHPLFAPGARWGQTRKPVQKFSALHHSIHNLLRGSPKYRFT